MNCGLSTRQIDDLDSWTSRFGWITRKSCSSPCYPPVPVSLPIFSWRKFQVSESFGFGSPKISYQIISDDQSVLMRHGSIFVRIGHQVWELRHMQCLSAFGIAGCDMLSRCWWAEGPETAAHPTDCRNLTSETCWLKKLQTAVVFGTILWWWNSMLTGSGVTWIWKRSWNFHWCSECSCMLSGWF